MSTSYGGKILYLDLTTGKTRTVPTENYKQYLGGRGINQKLLFENCDQSVEPLSPDNPFILGSGSLTGTNLPGANRMCFNFKSPTSGHYGLAVMGGYFPVEMKTAGYDHMVITGKAKELSYLYIQDNEIKILKADHLKGLDTIETIDSIKKDHDGEDMRVACIGPAGESLARVSTVISEYGHSGSGNGPGSIMGSKNLKAIGILGTKGIGLAHPEKFLKLADELRVTLLEHPFYESWNRRLGAENTSLHGSRKFANWGHLNEQERPQEWIDETLTSTKRMVYDFSTSNNGCLACGMRCRDFIKIPEIDPDRGYSFMPCMNWPTPSMIFGLHNAKDWFKWSVRATKDGFNVREMVHLVAFAKERQDAGNWTIDDFDGKKLEFGDLESMMIVVDKIIKREGPGKLLADGVWKTAQKLGGNVPNEILTIHKHHHAGMEVRTKNYGMWVSSSVSDCGESKRTATVIDKYAKSRPDLEKKIALEFIKEPELLIQEQKPWNRHIPIIYFEDIAIAADCLGICYNVTRHFGASGPIEFPQFAELHKYGTGFDLTADTIRTATKALKAMTRLWDMTQGRRKWHDKFDQKLPYVKPSTVGWNKGNVVDVQKQKTVVESYYDARGWDVETSLPKKETLDAWNLTDESKLVDSLREQMKSEKEHPYEEFD
ncbi:MAG: aldehyde ferredoxin oxidoreductase N-terminal domain-containing protein [Candidatus Ranarchaeia archaeon]